MVYMTSEEIRELRKTLRFLISANKNMRHAMLLLETKETRYYFNNWPFKMK